MLTGRLVLNPRMPQPRPTGTSAAASGPTYRPGRVLPPIRHPQIFGIAEVLAAFLLVEFVVGESTARAR